MSQSISYLIRCAVARYWNIRNNEKAWSMYWLFSSPSQYFILCFFLHSSLYSLKFYREEFKLGPHRGFIIWDEGILWAEKWCIKDILKENSSICKGLLQPNGGNVESVIWLSHIYRSFVWLPSYLSMKYLCAMLGAKKTMRKENRIDCKLPLLCFAGHRLFLAPENSYCL